jgi:hypothetical protein
MILRRTRVTRWYLMGRRGAYFPFWGLDTVLLSYFLWILISSFILLCF